jgi:hypothetical protein
VEVKSRSFQEKSPSSPAALNDVAVTSLAAIENDDDDDDTDTDDDERLYRCL